MRSRVRKTASLNSDGWPSALLIPLTLLPCLPLAFSPPVLAATHSRPHGLVICQDANGKAFFQQGRCPRRFFSADTPCGPAIGSTHVGDDPACYGYDEYR